ncbi:MAG: hypothetical protein K2K16_00480 [Ruminococcus sp.]|nr:hypothetical protein [Ruminococcus sp.]
MSHKPFGILRLQKLVFNCILHHMENAEEILSILRADIRRNGRKEVFHYKKSRIRSGYFTEKILVYVDINDNTVVGLSVVAQTCSDGYRTVYINDILNDDSLLDFAFYNADFSFCPAYGIDNNHLSFSDIIRTEETVPEVSAPELPEQSDDVPETTDNTETHGCERCSDCVHYTECDKKHTPKSSGCRQYVKRRYHIRE